METEAKRGVEMASANPKDLVKEFKTSRAGDVMTLLVKPEFVPAWTSNDDQPYRVYDKSFSRLVVTILWKSPNGGKMSVTGNIKIDKLAGIYRKAVNASQIDAVMSSVAFKWFAGSLQNMMDMLQNPKCTEDAGRGSVDDRIVRSEKELDGAIRKARALEAKCPREKNRLALGLAMLMSAKERRESRGAHYREDFPDTDESFRRQTAAVSENGEPKIGFRPIPERRGQDAVHS